MKSARIIGICLLFLLTSAVPTQAGVVQPAVSVATLTQVAPAACPAVGCAAGQRLSFHMEYEVGVYNKATAPNIKVCVYIPSTWLDAPSTVMSAKGGSTAKDYTKIDTCTEDTAPPAGYSLAAADSAALDQNFFKDSLDLSFRIAAGGSGQGSLLLRVFENSGTDAAPAWQRSSQIFTSELKVAARAIPAYVADVPSTCGTSSPCYLNSAGDLAGGIGTGLRDAVDALDASQPNLQVVVLGSAPLRGSTVLVTKPVTIVSGSANAQITVESGASCSNAAPLLELDAGGGLKGLIVNDGPCSGASDRPLVVVNSPADVLIESNTFTAGADALRVIGNTGNVTVRYNQITGNSGYALHWDATPSTAHLFLVANNLYQNRAGDPVECAETATGPNANRVANHNYWGSAAAPAATHCTLGAGKQLGAPIAVAASGVGVDAQRVTVGTNKTYAFSNQIAYQRTGGSGDFDLYIINHGTSSPDSIPFIGNFSIPNLCSNVWDVFLPEGVVPNGELDLFVRYSRSAACTAAVEIPTFCGQTSNPQNYPLWWYDPRGQVTGGWDTVGQAPAGSGAGGATGQAASCSTANHEIKVAIDATGRPELANDLGFTPFLVGIPVTNTFTALASDHTVSLQWTTLSEPDTTGYIVTRSLNAAGPFDPITDVIARKGSATGGSTYSFGESGLTNGTAYYYRLKLLRGDGGYTLSDVVAIVPNIATVTPTPTITQTPTITLTLTPSVTWTPYPTLTPYRFFTATYIYVPATRVPAATLTRFVSPTSAHTTPQISVTVTPSPGTAAVTVTAGGYPGPGTGTPEATEIIAKPQTTSPPGAITAGIPTITATASRTSAPTLTYADQVKNSSRFISLIMGLVLGGLLFFGTTWFLFFRKRVL